MLGNVLGSSGGNRYPKKANQSAFLDCAGAFVRVDFALRTFSERKRRRIYFSAFVFRTTLEKSKTSKKSSKLQAQKASDAAFCPPNPRRELLNVPGGASPSKCYSHFERAQKKAEGLLLAVLRLLRPLGPKKSSFGEDSKRQKQENQSPFPFPLFKKGESARVGKKSFGVNVRFFGH